MKFESGTFPYDEDACLDDPVRQGAPRGNKGCADALAMVCIGYRSAGLVGKTLIVGSTKIQSLRDF